MALNRRTFVLGSPLAASAATLQDTPRIPTAVIGTGNRGSYLLSGVLEVPSAKVVALCDNKPDRLDRAATAASKDNPFTSTEWRRVIERRDVDAVFIATPPHLHAEMAVAAIEAGKHVYCEKPIGISPAQIRQILAAVGKSKKVFVAGQQLRAVNQLKEAVAKIHAGAIGEVTMVKAQRHATADLPHDGTSGDWYFDVTKSGGYLIEQSVHNLDLCNWAINALPLKASGFGSIQLYKNQPPGRTIFDCGTISFRYPNGVLMSFTQNVFHPRAMPAGGQYIHVFGTKGSVDLMGAATMYPLSQGEPVVLAEKRQERPHALLEAFYEAITTGAVVPVDAAGGAAAALTAILGHEAMVRETVVNWADMGVKL